MSRRRRALLRTRAFSAAMIAAAGVALVACASDAVPEPTPTQSSVSLEGTWNNPSGTEFLEFRRDGTFVGFDNCNTSDGFWTPTANGARLRFDGGTEKGCPEGTVWLITAEEAVATGDASLELRDGSGTLVGELDRQGS